MKIPNADKAIIDPDKLSDYILSPKHPVGRFKAAFFERLGYSLEKWKILERDLRNQILSQDCLGTEDTRYGRKFIIEGFISGPSQKTAKIVTVWVIIKGESNPRFITAYPGG